MEGIDPLQTFARIIAPLKNRVLSMLSRGRVNTVDDSADLQLLELTVLKGEIRREVERLQNYGFTSHPPKDAEVAVLSIGGNRDHLLAIAVDDPASRKRDLAPGEVAAFSDEGDFLLFKRGQIIVISAGAQVHLGGDGASDPVVRQSDLKKVVDTFNDHTHPAITTGTVGATATPGKVTVSAVAATSKATATGSEKVFSA